MFTWFWCLVLVIFNVFACVFTCHTFNNIQVNAITKEGRHLKVNVDGGCLERVAFDGETMVEIDVDGQDVPVIMKDSIRHLVKLRSLTVRNGNLAEVKPATFRNVPSLARIQIFQTSLQIVPKGFFNNTPALEDISLHHNKIYFIEDYTFAFLDNLKTLNLSYNRLEIINRKLFYDLPSMTSLDLQHNSIKTIPPKAFANLKNVSYISLDYNEIGDIQPLAFEGLKDVKYLGLKHNRLSAMDYRSFPDKMSVDLLYVEGNNLNFLPVKILQKLKAIAPDGNPWKCPCSQYMSRELKTVRSTECITLYIPVCIQPKRETQVCEETEDEEIRSIFYNHVNQYRDKPEGRCVRFN